MHKPSCGKVILKRLQLQCDLGFRKGQGGAIMLCRCFNQSSTMQGTVISDFLLLWMLYEIWNNPKNGAHSAERQQYSRFNTLLQVVVVIKMPFCMKDDALLKFSVLIFIPYSQDQCIFQIYRLVEVVMLNLLF